MRRTELGFNSNHVYCLRIPGKVSLIKDNVNVYCKNFKTVMSTANVLQTPFLPLNLPSSPFLGTGIIDDNFLSGETVEPRRSKMLLHPASLASRSCTSLASLTLTNGSSSTLTDCTLKPLVPPASFKKPLTKQEMAAVLTLLESVNSHVEEEVQRLKAYIKETHDCVEEYKRERRERLIQKKKPRFGDRLRVPDKGVWYS